MFYKPGEMPSAFAFNLAIEGGRPRYDISDNDTSRKDIIVELVPGVDQWNKRSVEVTMDSVAYSTIVKTVGEVQARNCLMPAGGAENVYKLKDLGTDKTCEGISLKSSNYPQVNTPFAYEASDNFVLLCGDQSATKDTYLYGYPGDWTNGYSYDQYKQGSLVYVLSSPVGYVATPTQVDGAFPCIIKTNPTCYSWSFNTASVLLENGQQYRFDNRLEFLVNLAKGLLVKYLNIDPTVESIYDYTRQQYVYVANDKEGGLNYYRESFYSAIESAAATNTALSRWLSIIASNLGYDSSTSASSVGWCIFSALQGVKSWLANSKTHEGLFNPTNKCVGLTGNTTAIIGDDALASLGCLVNNTDELRQATALTMVVTPLVPGETYTTYTDSILAEVKQEDPDTFKTLTDSKKLIWAGNRLTALNKETFDSKNFTKQIARNLEARLESMQKKEDALAETVTDMVGSQSKVDYSMTVSVPDEPIPTFTPVSSTTETGPRKPALLINPEFVSKQIRDDGRCFHIYTAPLSGRAYRLIMDELSPADGYVETSFIALVVDHEVAQKKWLKFLFGFIDASHCVSSTMTLGKERIYSLFGGTYYVPKEFYTQLQDFVDDLNYVSSKSKICSIDGYTLKKKGYFYRKVTENAPLNLPNGQDDEIVTKYEVYPYWYDIVKAEPSKSPVPDTMAETGTTVIYACSLDDYEGTQPTMYSVVPHMEDDVVVGYEIAEGGSYPFAIYGGYSATGFVTFQDILTYLGDGAVETIVDPTIVSVNPETGAITKQRMPTATYVENTDKSIYDGAHPSKVANASIVDFVYQPPPASVAVPEEKEKVIATVVLPIKCCPVFPMIKPAVYGAGDCVFDGSEIDGYNGFSESLVAFLEILNNRVNDYNEQIDEENEDNDDNDDNDDDDNDNEGNEQQNQPKTKLQPYTAEDVIAISRGDTYCLNRLYKVLNENDKDEIEYLVECAQEVEVGGHKASCLVAKYMGVVELSNAQKSYQVAYYARKDKRPFCKKVSTEVKEGEEEPTVEEVLEKRLKANSVTVKKKYELESKKYLCFGVYEPEKTDSVDAMYVDLYDKTQPLYAQRVEPYTDESKKNGYVELVKLLKESENSDTCGWVKYCYHDEIKSNQQPETIKLKAPSIVSGSSGYKWLVGDKEIDPLLFTPFGYGSEGLCYGYAKVVNMDKSTKEAKITFYPYATNDSTAQEESQDDDEDDYHAPAYDQYESYPFVFDGVPPKKAVMVTTKTYKAQRSDWVPALCETLDENEVLIPGMVVEILSDSNVIRNTTSNYMSVAPPVSYTTCLEGTPKLVYYKIPYSKPSDSDLEYKIIEADDVWITGIKQLKDKKKQDDSPGNHSDDDNENEENGNDEEVDTIAEWINQPPGAVFCAGVSFSDSTHVPEIREPYGAFNDCANKASMTVFVRQTVFGAKYTCTGRLDYIPFGYAVPSKTPSCYYKTASDDCSVTLVSTKYLIKRLEADTASRLYLVGACYVPCATLTSFN